MSATAPGHASEELIRTFCEKALGGRISSAETRYRTCALTFDDGRRIVAKVTRSDDRGIPHLSAAYRIQEGLRRMGVPCPPLMAGPESLNDDWTIVVHGYFAPGTPHNCETPQHLQAVAEGLHALKKKMEGAPYHGLGVQAACDTSAMPERLRALVKKWEHVREAAGDWALMHGDFKARNLRFEGTTIRAVYDFESLRIGSESYLVGYSSVAFSGGHERLAINFGLDSAHAFIGAYERARGEPFTETQRKAAHGGMIHSLISMGQLLVVGGAITAGDLADRILAFEREIQSRLFANRPR